MELQNIWRFSYIIEKKYNIELFKGIDMGALQKNENRKIVKKEKKEGTLYYLL